MEPSARNPYRAYIESVEQILDALRQKERYVEELNTPDLSGATQVVRNKLREFESLYRSTESSPQAEGQNQTRLTDSQRELIEKAIVDAGRAVESNSLKVIEDSIRNLESFREQISE